MRLLAFLFLVPAIALAQDLKVLSGGAAKSLVDPLAASFKGGKVHVQYEPMGKLVESLAQGAQVDMVIVTEETLPRLEKEGRVKRGATVGDIGITLGVLAGASLISDQNRATAESTFDRCTSREDAPPSAARSAS